MRSFLSKLFIKENQTEYKETLNRFQGEIDAIQSLLDELRTEIEQELPKPKKKVKAKPKKKPAPKPAALTQREHGELRVQRNNQFKSNSIKKYRMERLVRDTLEKHKRAPLSPNKQMLTTHQLAKRWKCNSATLAKWCLTGKAKGYKSAASSESRGYWLVDANWVRSFEEKILRGEF